jgi:hypothetical protein
MKITKKNKIIKCKLIKCVLISQNTTVLAQMVHRVSTVSATCFGLYIGHRQVVFNLSSNYTICVVYFGGGGQDLFYKSGWHENLNFG